MHLKNLIKFFGGNSVLGFLRKKFQSPYVPVSKFLGDFQFESSCVKDIKDDIRKKYLYDGDLLEIFISGNSGAINKWHHYIPVYDRYLSRFTGKSPRVLELGVANGGGLQMWRRYFGESAVIFGVDISPECASFDGMSASVRIGSQADEKFLRAVVDEMGGGGHYY
ncbi:hypothetical protein F2Q65_14110 [Thiohalocapsa marina]|uniref:Class I SAM-dependent methyltransferase n=1 Tax=Thiohalocapsa marina TaxID=424902 RepID=A0A5M8FGT9_9GAMM|nr:hypothetical protein [Thiohalocapsa marina]KAA6183937.1 hypothetical protein F2Q65_14110 [Thiohalocapsa marina]